MGMFTERDDQPDPHGECRQEIERLNTAVLVAREARDTAEARAKEAVQAEMAQLREEIRRLSREVEQHISWEAAEHAAARAGVAISDCPYHSFAKSPELRDSTLSGLWKRGHDTATRGKLVEALRPFAEAFERTKKFNISPDMQDDYDRNVITPSGVVCGDFRRAWEAMGGKLERELPK